MSSRIFSLLTALGLTVLSGCSTLPARQQAGADVQPLTPESIQHDTNAAPPSAEPGKGIAIAPEEHESTPPKPEVQLGTGKFIDEEAARRALPGGGGEGQVVFNFENQPIQAVVKAILGDLLQENYTIAPNVGGNVSFSTSKPIRSDQAMSVLEMLLSWTGNTLIHTNGRYTVLQIKDALPGNLSPRVGAPNLARGYEVRVFPLHYISPSEMAKLLKPYAKPEAFISVDTARSMLVLAGTASELVNYQRTIDVFDVDWLKGMSVGVFTLQSVEVGTLLPELEKVFGATGESPLAGMFRFIPIERSNAIVAITPQPEYLRQAEDWLRRLDRSAGQNGTQFYIYDVKNIKAADLADYLSQIFVGASTGSSSRRTSTSGSVGQGLSAVTIGGIGGTGGSGLNYQAALPKTTPAAEKPPTPAGGTSSGASGGSGHTDIRISAVEENNQLMVLATPSEWDSMQAAIRRLDVAPLQVQIETKILEVSLTGELKFGVQWYFAGLINTAEGSPPVGYNRPYERHRSSLGTLSSIAPGSSSLFYSYLNKNLEFAINALETSGTAKVLSAPSLVVMNNQQAKINVGTQIPVVQTYLSSYTPVITSTTNGNTNNTSQNYSGTGTVQYLNTGVILDVKPRVNPGGLVYLEIAQEVSKPGTPAAGSNNPPINQRQLQTQIAVQSGETVMLGGLISEDEQHAENGVPGLNRVPILGRLFGTTDRNRQRTELIVLITPQVIANVEDAREITEEYKRQFQSLAPLRSQMNGGRARPVNP